MMRIKIIPIVLLLGMGLYLTSCSPKNISEKYYFENEAVLDSMEESYKTLYQQSPFAVAFTDKFFKYISLEISTDSLSYIYEFEVSDPRLQDSLVKYRMDAPKVMALIKQMQSIRCTWINSFDYYVDEKKNSTIFVSIKPVALKALFSDKKYYILTYFSQPQYFNSRGLLLDKRERRRLRKINGEIFKRINDKVCYTISGTYR